MSEKDELYEAYDVLEKAEKHLEKILARIDKKAKHTKPSSIGDIILAKRRITDVVVDIAKHRRAMEPVCYKDSDSE